MTTTWQSAAATANAARDATIPREWLLPPNLLDPAPKDSTPLLAASNLLTPLELTLVSLPAASLAAAIARGEYTAVQATTAYCKAAAVAQQATNCLIELFPAEALARARELDGLWEHTDGKGLGALHGVPVSIKDHIAVKGHDSPCAFLGLVGKMVQEEDAYMVAALRAAGAVFYCKTTNPQSTMHLETSGYFGTTVAPHNRALTAGGSSGGEGALLGMCGSPLGVGTDIGGSVRSPAAACGAFAFKPTVGRVPYIGCLEPGTPLGYDGILGTHGPMARHEGDLELYMKVLLGSEPWKVDPSTVFRPWDEGAAKAGAKGRKLRIGVLWDDGVVRPVATVRRALDAVVGALQRSGKFEVVEYTPGDGAEAWDIISKLYWAGDGGKATLDQIHASGEPVLPLTQWIIDEGRWGADAAATPQLLELFARRDAFRASFAAHWQASGVDVVLSPVGPSPAPQHGTAKYWNYTSFWNLVNYPAAVFPTGMFSTAQDVQDADYKARNAREQYVLDTYDAGVSAGAPLGLQLIGFIGDDESLIGALKEVMSVRGVAGW